MKKATLPFLIVPVLLITLSSCEQIREKIHSSNNTSILDWQEQYDLGIRYLSESNYEEAIIAFTAAIEIDPKSAAAYIGLADAYIGMGNSETAAQVLSDALNVADDGVPLQNKLDEVNGSLQNVGYLRTERIDNPDGGYRVIEYDKFDNVVKSTSYEADNTEVACWEYTYNDHQHRKGYYFINKKYGFEEYGTYDDNGRLAEEHLSDVDGRDDRHIVYHYTEDSAEVNIDFTDYWSYYNYLDNPNMFDGQDKSPVTYHLHFTMQSPQNSIEFGDANDDHEGNLEEYTIYEYTPDGKHVTPDGEFVDEIVERYFMPDGTEIIY